MHGAVALTPTRALLGCLALWLVLLTAPGGWSGALGGAPFTTPARALLAASAVLVAGLVVTRPTRQVGAAVLVAMLGLIAFKLALGYLDVPSGWRAEYQMLEPSPPKTAGFAWRLRYHRYRIDPVLTGRADRLDLPFLNDLQRFNQPPFPSPRAQHLPLRITWSGWFNTTRPDALQVYAQATGPLALSLDGHALRVKGEPGLMAVPVEAGWHSLVVAYDKPAETMPAVFVKALLGDTPLELRPWPAHRIVPTVFLGRLSDGAVAVGFLVLLWQFVATGLTQRRPLAAPTAASDRTGVSTGRSGALLVIAAAAIIALRAAMLANGAAGATVEWGPGEDHLAYEGLARNILEEGLLMPEGKPLGQGTPYFFYPLYSYALAAFHLAVGDEYSSIVLMNGLAAVTLPVSFWLLGWGGMATAAQALGQALLVAFVLRHDAVYWTSPLTDNLFVPLVFISLWVAGLALTRPKPRFAWYTGMAVAVTAMTRPSFYLFLGPFALVAFYAGGRARLGVTAGRLLRIAGGYAAAFLPLVLRNWIVARQAVAMVTLSHAIPISLIPPEQPERLLALPRGAIPWTESLGLAWSIVAADPWGVAWLEARKILFTLGLTNLGPAGHPLLLEFPLLAVAAATAAMRGRVPRDVGRVIAAFLVSHFIAITIAYPWTYGYKTILPVQLAFLFCGMFIFSPARQLEGGRD